jgi:NDP-sugar pyrophosphorylase family protein
VLVFNGDVLSGADLHQLLDYHRSNQADVTLHLVRVSDPRAFGCVPTEDGRVTAFLEKAQDPPTDQINAAATSSRARSSTGFPAVARSQSSVKCFPRCFPRV